jgi:hypothetical protein
MKKRKMQIFAVFALVALLGIGSAIAAYTVWTEITDVTITSPSDGSTVYVGVTYEDLFACTTSTDIDCNVGVGIVSDTVTHTWSGSGTFTPTTGVSGIDWTSPGTTGDVTITVTASDSPLADDTNKTDSITLTVAGFDRAFWVLDDSGNTVAIFDALGNLFIEGTMDESTTHTATATNEFRIQDSSGVDVAIIDADDGNMYIDGSIYEDQTISTVPADAFEIKNASGTTVAYIEDDGDVYLAESLYESVSF